MLSQAIWMREFEFSMEGKKIILYKAPYEPTPIFGRGIWDLDSSWEDIEGGRRTFYIPGKFDFCIDGYPVYILLSRGDPINFHFSINGKTRFIFATPFIPIMKNKKSILTYFYLLSIKKSRLITIKGDGNELLEVCHGFESGKLKIIRRNGKLEIFEKKR